MVGLDQINPNFSEDGDVDNDGRSRFSISVPVKNGGGTGLPWDGVWSLGAVVADKGLPEVCSVMPSIFTLVRHRDGVGLFGEMRDEGSRQNGAANVAAWDGADGANLLGLSQTHRALRNRDQKMCGRLDVNLAQKAKTGIAGRLHAQVPGPGKGFGL